MPNYKDFADSYHYQLQEGDLAEQKTPVSSHHVDLSCIFLNMEVEFLMSRI